MATIAHNQSNTTEPPARPVWISPGLSIDITSCRFTDLRSIARLQRRCFRKALAYRLGTLWILHVWPRATCLVARAGESIVGNVIGDVHGGQSRVVSICVHPEWQRHGIGIRLLAEIESRLPTGNMILMVETENEIAQQLYRRAGYIAVGESCDYYGRGRNGVWMQKTRSATQ